MTSHIFTALAVLASLIFIQTAGASTPYSGSPFILSTSAPITIQAAQFDNGGSNDAYYDTTSGNSGSVFRTTNVDIQASSEGGYSIGWIAAGEWLRYTVDVRQAGCYTVIARVASPDSLATKTLQVEGDGGSVDFNLPYTGGWQVWTDVSQPNLCFPSTGVQIVTVRAITSRFNLKSLQFVAQTSGTSPFASVNLPGRIEAENFDYGGSGSAYYDTTSGNNGDVYRSTNVDLQSCAEGGYNIGWIDANEWYQYTVNVNASGSFDFDVRVASPYDTGRFDLLVDGTVVASNVAVPNTGAWQTWRSVRIPNIRLNSGQRRIRIRALSRGFNINYINVSNATIVTSSNLRIMQWNIQHGDAGVTNLTNEMRASGADVIILNESHETLVAEYKQRLESLTGVTWYSVYRSGNGSDGNTILSRIPFLETQTARWTAPNSSCYPTRSAVRAAIRFNNVRIQIFSFHNDTCADNRDYLIDRLKEFMAPTSQDPQILAGDFNAGDSENSIKELINPNSPYYGEFYDVWNFITGETGSHFDSKTRSWRIDYHFVSRDNRVLPIAVWLRNFDYSFSDHRSVVADYSVTP